MWKLGVSPDDTLIRVLDQALRLARIRFELPGRTAEAGRSAAPSGEPEFIIRVTDTDFSRRIITGGNLGLAECYMDGGFSMERGTLDGLLTVFARSDLDQKLHIDPRILFNVAIMRLQHVFTNTHAKVQQHYDAGNDVYELFLDETMGYTCGYQKSPDDTLAQLQAQKYDRVCQKLQLQEGQTLLDIGCGWGTMIIHAATHYGVRAHGITIAKNQAEWATQRVRRLGLEHLVTVQYGDYQEARGSYDRIVSIGMMEHLYPREHDTYFQFVSDHLTAGGIGLSHFMSAYKARTVTDPFTQKYIFPGSTHPRLSSIASSLEKFDMAVLDVENIARHYLPTARHWLANWRANVHRIDRTKYDERFVRMFEYILCCYVAACDAVVSSLLQILFTKDIRQNLPLHRI